jgi:hypothetical protein
VCNVQHISSSSIIGSIVKLDRTSAPFVRYVKHRNKVLTVATLVARNSNEAMVVVGVQRLESGGRFCVDVFGFSRHECVFTFN